MLAEQVMAETEFDVVVRNHDDVAFGEARVEGGIGPGRRGRNGGRLVVIHRCGGVLWEGVRELMEVRGVQPDAKLLR